MGREQDLAKNNSAPYILFLLKSLKGRERKNDFIVRGRATDSDSSVTSIKGMLDKLIKKVSFTTFGGGIAEILIFRFGKLNQQGVERNGGTRKIEKPNKNKSSTIY